MAVTRVGLGGPSSAYAGFFPKSAQNDLNTRCKRASSVNLLVPSTLAPVTPDGTINHGDRQHAAKTYCGILSIRAYSLTAEAGSYTITGADVNTSLAAVVSPGTYLWTGADLTTSVAYGIILSPGVYTWTGVSLTLRAGPIYFAYITDPQFADLGVRASSLQFGDSGVRMSDAQFVDLNVRISDPKRKT